jgi:T-complex protein 1 subunit zeta
MREKSKDAPQTQVFRQEQAQTINFHACHLLADLIRTNIGPRGTLKMFESEKGELSLTKDGGDLINQLTIIHPTAIFLGRSGKAQEKAFHDGVSSLITLIDAILKQCEFKLSDGVHPRVLVHGLEEARVEALKQLDRIAIPSSPLRSNLKDYASSASFTKSNVPVADVVVDAINLIRSGDSIDLDRIEIVKIRSASESVRLVRGLVLDQCFRHELMPKQIKNVRILALNVSLELENSAVNALVHVANADQRERMIIAERKFVDDKLRSIIQLKALTNSDFLLMNGKGIDGPCLDMLSHANISAVRRVSRKTLQRLIYATGCKLVNCVDDLMPNVLGFAGKVTEENHRGKKYVFIDEVEAPKAVSIVIGGMTDSISALTESAVKDSLRALQHTIEDHKVLPGAGAIEVALHLSLMNEFRTKVEGKNRIGVEVLAEAPLAIPRALAQNAGLNAATVIPDLLSEAEQGGLAGIEIETGEVIDPTEFGIFDTYRVVRGIVQSAPIVASRLLLVDSIIQRVQVDQPSGDDWIGGLDHVRNTVLT